MMRGRTAPTLLCAILVALLHASFPGRISAQAAGSIVGRIRITPGNEIKSPILVTLSSRGETVNSIYSDSEGNFGFSGLPGNLYHLVINEEGYLPVQEDVSVDPVTTSMKLVTIDLVPSEAKAKSSPQIKGGNTRLADSNRYAQQIPKGARKQFEKGVRSDKDGKPDAKGKIVIVGIGAFLLGFPNPAFFGLAAAVLNYIPYVGPAVMVMILFGVGLVTFPSLGHALLAPLGFVALTTAEGHFITPTIVGRRITLNPLLVFLALAFWTWLWGPIGAFLAAPLSIVGVVVFNHLFPQDDAKLPD